MQYISFAKIPPATCGLILIADCEECWLSKHNFTQVNHFSAKPGVTPSHLQHRSQLSCVLYTTHGFLVFHSQFRDRPLGNVLFVLSWREIFSAF